MIASATGTGKSVSLMVIAEWFTRIGVPSVVADVKGDIAGMSQAADLPGEKLQKRFDTLGLTDWKPQANPVIFWDLYAELGHPLRTSLAAKIGRASCRERVKPEEAGEWCEEQ